ncbi:SDR family oxidoreductase [Acinetobacter baumannii]|uniref:SDR family NAD(P)-dependent oxidoreductase n=1 Tax=Acinetobacter baumannii TaxID=470 RepID=UPI002956E22E|nr:SDR family oxidoreductase [Acinetobacter baumannii]MDV7609575.1 SDR family oxidoreductase [Acinetobacter baumannii]MDV7611366.1 SDR family oxidoreductase [Acinetobacter baumannii]MDV7615569.1 SDR family oxidoreductase [Acinetobacter baumannii]
MAVCPHITDLFSLQGKKALITNASSHLGRHFARTLGQAGAEIILASHQNEQLSDFLDELHQERIQANAIRMDVRKSSSIRQAFDVIETFNGPARIIINNTGLQHATNGQHEKNFLDTYLKRDWAVIREATSRLIASQRTGHIINIVPQVAKATLQQTTQVMALELAGYGICVNALLLGYMITDFNEDFIVSEAGEQLRNQIPGKRFGQPEHLNGPLLLLASDASRYITGTTLTVDGGHFLKTEL